MNFATASESLKLFLGKLVARSPLSPTEREEILSLPTTPLLLPAHMEIVRLGEQTGHAVLVADGLVARFAQMEDGRRQHVALHIAGDMPDLHSLVLPAAPAPLVALTATTVFHVPHASLRALSSAYSSIAAALWRECVIDGQIMMQWLVSVGRRDARGRLAHLLCEMATRCEWIGAYRNGSFPFPITQEQIADALGLTSVHVNRSLQALRQEGFVRVSRGEVTILDWDALVFAAEFDPAYLHLPDMADGARRKSLP